MVDLRRETHGAGSMKGVNLAVLAYDNRVARKDDVITTHYLDARMHPGDTRAAGQTTLALVTKKDEKSPTGYNNSARYSAGQFESIKEAAGDNVTDLTNQQGEVVGKIYGIKADLIISNKDMIINTKTIEPTELSVLPDADGKDIRSKIFESMAAAKAAKATAAPAAEAPAAEAPAAEKPAAKKAPAKRPSRAKAKPELAPEVDAAAASTDEPGLG